MTLNRGRVDGPTILLGSGRYFDITAPLDPPPTIEDVAWGLAFESRWSGQCVEKASGRRAFYSVAQHCCLMATEIGHSFDVRFAYAALMHEVEEFIFRDVAGPLKSSIPGYREKAKSVGKVLLDYFDVTQFDETIKQYDMRMLATERRDLTNDDPNDFWSYMDNVQPFEFSISPWTAEVAAITFLKMFDQLAPASVRENVHEPLDMAMLTGGIE